MTYEAILQELDEINLKEEFISEFESYVTPSLLQMMKDTDKIHSVGSAIRFLMKKWRNESPEWLYWQQVLQYFMAPVFTRPQNFKPVKF